jgi:hypothetical protein
MENDVLKEMENLLSFVKDFLMFVLLMVTLPLWILPVLVNKSLRKVPK